MFDVLKIDVPMGATSETPWRVTRLSRRRVYWPTRPERVALRDIGRLGYELRADPREAEPDSDVYTIQVDHMVSVTPMSQDLTSRTDLYRLGQIPTGEVETAPPEPPKVGGTVSSSPRRVPRRRP